MFWWPLESDEIWRIFFEKSQNFGIIWTPKKHHESQNGQSDNPPNFPPKKPLPIPPTSQITQNCRCINYVVTKSKLLVITIPIRPWTINSLQPNTLSSLISGNTDKMENSNSHMSFNSNLIRTSNIGFEWRNLFFCCFFLFLFADLLECLWENRVKISGAEGVRFLLRPWRFIRLVF